MTNWNYKNIGKDWIELDEDKQLEILNKFYPVGMILRYRFYPSNMKIRFTILGYSFSDVSKEFCVDVSRSDYPKDCYSVVPTAFLPDVEMIRDIKLNNILNG